MISRTDIRELLGEDSPFVDQILLGRNVFGALRHGTTYDSPKRLFNELCRLNAESIWLYQSSELCHHLNLLLSAGRTIEPR
jgi:hypothetical protein